MIAVLRGFGIEILGKAADMLEADAGFKPNWATYRQGVEDGKAEAQQVAVPAWKAGQQEPIPHSGADEIPPIFGRRWRLARDGFGLQRDDESGNYVQIDDAISTMHATLAAAQGVKP